MVVAPEARAPTCTHHRPLSFLTKAGDGGFCQPLNQPSDHCETDEGFVWNFIESMPFGTHPCTTSDRTCGVGCKLQDQDDQDALSNKSPFE